MTRIVKFLIFVIISAFAFNGLNTAEAATDKNPDLIYVKAGDTIIFGTYEQDNNPDNGPEPIEWDVLDSKDGNVLVVSKYVLDWKEYQTPTSARTTATWESAARSPSSSIARG